MAYLSAGRSSYLDGGIFLCALDPVKGEVIETRTLYSPDPETDEMLLPTFDRKVVPGALSDILVSDGSSVFMRQEKVFGDESGAKGHIFSTAGFRDDAWFNRTEWAIGTVSGAQLVVFDDQIACGIAAYSKGSQAHSFQTGDNGYQFFAGQWKPQLPRNGDNRPPQFKRNHGPPLDNESHVRIAVCASSSDSFVLSKICFLNSSISFSKSSRCFLTR